MGKNSRTRYHMLSSRYVGQTVGTSENFLFLGFVCPLVPCSARWLLSIIDENVWGWKGVCTDLGEGSQVGICN